MVDPDPEIDPGLIVQLPGSGKPDKTTLPEGVSQVGCVGTPGTGGDGCP